MKKFLVLALVLFCSSLFAQSFPEVFANAAFGKPIEATIDNLDKAGVSFKIDDGLLVYKASIGGYEWDVITESLYGKVVRVFAVRYDQNTYRAYLSMRDTLQERYGKPFRAVEFFRKPFYAGDGYEDTAIVTGKASLLSAWSGHNWSINVMATKDSKIVLMYVSDTATVTKADDEAEKKKKEEF